MVHIFTASGQPLTRFQWYGCDEFTGFAPNDTTFKCHTCGRRRAAKNLLVQSFYDKDHIYCKEGHDMDRWGRWKTRTPVTERES